MDWNRLTLLYRLVALGRYYQLPPVLVHLPSYLNRIPLCRSTEINLLREISYFMNERLTKISSSRVELGGFFFVARWSSFLILSSRVTLMLAEKTERVTLLSDICINFFCSSASLAFSFASNSAWSTIGSGLGGLAGAPPNDENNDEKNPAVDVVVWGALALGAVFRLGFEVPST